MKVLHILINLTLCATYNLINGHIQQKEYYISSKISDEHKLWVYDAINIIRPYKNLVVAGEYTSDRIRIKYDGLRYTGFTDYIGYLNNDNTWTITDISIGVNPTIEFYNAFLLIMLHEIIHSLGCFHSDVLNSIMNSTMTVVNGVVQDVEYPVLHIDDIECLGVV